MTSVDESRTTPRVVAVVPTLGAPHVVAAVRSALDQTYPNLEVVVSVDGPAADLAALLPDDGRLRVVWSAESRGPRAARAAGIDAAGPVDYIALLDDDDRWHPDKISRQVAAAEAAIAAGARNVAVLCRMNLVEPDGRTIQTVPRRLLSPGERVADYLFVRREVKPGSAVVAASMALLSREAALDAMRTGASHLHEDWEALMRLDDDPSTVILMLDEVLLDYVVQPVGGSASSRAAWRMSRDWFVDHRSQLTPRELGDGLLCVTAVLAAAQGDRRGAMAVAHSVLAERSAGWRAWAFFGATILVPRRLARALSRRRVPLPRASGTGGRTTARQRRRS